MFGFGKDCLLLRQEASNPGQLSLLISIGYVITTLWVIRLMIVFLFFIPFYRKNGVKNSSFSIRVLAWFS